MMGNITSADLRRAGVSVAGAGTTKGRNNIARAVRHESGAMNKTEARYASHLELRRIRGEVASYTFEKVKIRIADNTFYTPDFFVVLPTMEIEFHEVKGFWEDDARVKIKVAAETFPARFIAVKERPKKLGGGWDCEEF